MPTVVVVDEQAFREEEDEQALAEEPGEAALREGDYLRLQKR